MASRISCVMAPLALIAAIAPLSAQGFEGVVTMHVATDKGASHDVEYQVKDGKLRVEIEGRGSPPSAIVIDPVNQRMLIMMTAQKMYMDRSLAGGAVSAKDAERAAARATVTPTGKKETIAGHECEHVLVTDDDGASVDVCVAHGMGGFMAAPTNPMAGGSSGGGWLSKLGNDAFPLKVTKGSTVVLEVTKIEQKSLDPSLFAPPEGWRKFDLPNLPGMRPPTG